MPHYASKLYCNKTGNAPICNELRYEKLQIYILLQYFSLPMYLGRYLTCLLDLDTERFQFCQLYTQFHTLM